MRAIPMRWLCLLLVMVMALAACSTPGRGVDSAALREHPEHYIVLAVHNEVTAAYPHAGSTERSYGSAMPYAQSARARHLLNRIAADYQLQPVASWPIHLLAMECVIFKPAATTSREQLLAQLNRDARVMLAQPLQSFDTHSTPDNAGRQHNHQYNDAYADLQTNLQRMSIAAAHRWSRGQGVRVAVVDTGVDSAHPELRGRIDAQRNFVDGDAVQFRRDRHGTAVAGVIAANANNGIGIVGIAPEARLLALKACWQLQTDRDAARCNTFTLAQALASAIELHAQVINLSVVGPSDPLLSALLRRADAAGIVIVGAVDSDAPDQLAPGQSTLGKRFPVDDPAVLGVTMMEQVDSAHSSWLQAPGREVLSLMPGEGYDFTSGSSIAAAQISGTVALLLAAGSGDHAINVGQLRQLLALTSESNGPNPWRSVNACLALWRLDQHMDPHMTCDSPLRTAERATTTR